MYANNWLYEGKVNILTQLNLAYWEHIISIVRNNCYILKNLIYCVKFWSAFELVCRVHHENEELENH